MHYALKKVGDTLRTNFSNYIEQAKIERTKQERVLAVLMALSLVVAMVVSWQLRQTGITIAEDLVAACGHEEHIHTDECYGIQCVPEQQDVVEISDIEDVEEVTVVSQVAMAEITESTQAVEDVENTEEVEAADEAEQPAEPTEAPEQTAPVEEQVVTQAPVAEEEITTTAPVDEEEQTTAALPLPTATEPEQAGHTHIDECFVLVCEKPEHTHDTTCFSDPSSDLVYQMEWEQEIDALNLRYDAALSLIQIANSQIGYTESTTNFITDSNFVRHGYTKYADWYGGEGYWYYNWSAIFASFCLYYAHGGESAWDMSANAVDVINSTVSGMVAEAKTAGYYHSADETTFKPDEGDMIVFKLSGSDTEYVGIITYAYGSSLSFIAGDVDDQVKKLDLEQLTYNVGSITGYIETPEKTAQSTPALSLGSTSTNINAASGAVSNPNYLETIRVDTGRKRYRVLSLNELASYINTDTPVLVFAQEGNNYYALGDGGVAAGGLGINASDSEGGTTAPTTTTVTLLTGSYSFSSWDDNSIPDGIETTNEVTSVSAGGVITVNYTINGSVAAPQLQIYHGNWTTGGTLILTGCNEYGAYDVTGGTSVSFTLTADQATLINNNKNGNVLFQLKAPGLTITSFEYTYETTSSAVTGISTVTGVPQNADLYKWKVQYNNGSYSLVNARTGIPLGIYPGGNFSGANSTSGNDVNYNFTGGYNAAFAEAFTFVENWELRYLKDIEDKNKYIANGSGLTLDWDSAISPGAVAMQVYDSYIMTTHVKKTLGGYGASVFVGLPNTKNSDRQDLWNEVKVADGGSLIGTTGLQIALSGDNKVKVGVFNGNAGSVAITDEISLPSDVNIAETAAIKVIYNANGGNGAITIFVGGKYIATAVLDGRADNVNMVIRGEGEPYTYVQRTCYTSGTIYTCDGQTISFSDMAIAVPNAATGDGTVGYGMRGNAGFVVQDYAMAKLSAYSYETEDQDQYSTELYVYNSSKNNAFDYNSNIGAFSIWPANLPDADNVYFAIEEDVYEEVHRIEAAAENIEMHVFNYGAAINDYIGYTDTQPGTAATQAFVADKTYSGYPFYAEHSYGNSVDGTISNKISYVFYGEMTENQLIDGVETPGYYYTYGINDVYPYRQFSMMRCLNSTGYPALSPWAAKWQDAEKLVLDFLFDTSRDFVTASDNKTIYDVTSFAFASGDTDNKFFDQYGRDINNIYTDTDDNNAFAKIREFAIAGTYDPVTNPNYVSKHFEVENDGEGTGLFQINDDGFYVYNSAENAAYFNQETGKFEIYDYTLIPNEANAENADLQGNFLPFNLGHEQGVWVERGRYDNPLPGNDSLGYYVGDVDYGDDKRMRLASYQEYMTGRTYVNSAGETVEYMAHNDEFNPATMRDCWFGMTMEFDFYMPEDGKVVNPLYPDDDTKKNEMTFSFSGDDDVLVYIDGVLVLDISGTHPVYTGSINFATGEVIYQNSSNGGAGAVVTTTIRKQFDAAVQELIDNNQPEAAVELQEYIEKVFQPGGDTFKFRDFTKHTLNFYYLERGGNISNCSLAFNIAPVPKGELVVAKEVTDIDGITSGADNHQQYVFQLMMVPDNEWGSDRVSTNGGADGGAIPVTKEYTYDLYVPGEEPVIGMKTYDNGKFILRNGESAKFTDLDYYDGDDSDGTINRITYGVHELLDESKALAGDDWVEISFTLFELSEMVNGVEHASWTRAGTFSFTARIEPNVDKTVMFRNIPAVELNVTKVLESENVDTTKQFTFTGTYTYMDGGTRVGENDVFTTDNVATIDEFALTAGSTWNSVTNGNIKIPLGSVVTITETSTDGYSVVITDSTDANTTIKGNVYTHFLTGDTTVTFINTTGPEMPSTGGIGAEPMMYLGAGLCLTTLTYGYSLRRKRERRFM